MLVFYPVYSVALVLFFFNLLPLRKLPMDDFQNDFGVLHVEGCLNSFPGVCGAFSVRLRQLGCIHVS